MRKKQQHIFIAISCFLGTFLILILLSYVLPTIFYTFTGKPIEQFVHLDVTIANNPPVIDSIYAVPDQAIREGSYSNISISFVVHDIDGYQDINLSGSSAWVSNEVGESRMSALCYNSGIIDAHLLNVTCVVPIWFFDKPSVWNISVKTKDRTGAGYVINNGTTFILLKTVAFVISPSVLNLSTIVPDSYNQTPVNSPLTLNNTGNAFTRAGLIKINATNLRGIDDSSVALYAGNFSVGIATGPDLPECGAPLMARSTYRSISGAVLQRGNYSINNGTAGQEELYPCLTYAGSELTPQQYSTAAEGAWTVQISG